MMSQPRTFVLGLAALLALGACAAQQPGQWVHPSKPEDRWGLDKQACLQWAEARVSADYPGRTFEPPLESGAIADSSLRRSLDSFEARKQRTTLFNRCMHDRGYRLAQHP